MKGIFQTFWKSVHDNKGPILHLLFFLKKKMLPIKNTKRFKNKNDKRAKTAFSKPFDPASY